MEMPIRRTVFAPLRRFRSLAAAAVLAAVLPAGSAWGDTITYRSGAAAPQAIEVTIQKAEGGKLYYVSTQSGNPGDKPLENIVTINAPKEPALTLAETAFAASKWEDAARDYGRALDGSKEAWVKTRAVARLAEAANKSGQFAPAARAYVELVKTDLPAAAKLKLDVPKDKPEAVKEALGSVDRALGSPLRADQTELLKTFKAQLLIASGQGAEAAKILNTGAAAPAAPAGVGAAATAAPAMNESQRRIAADRAMLAADQAFKDKNYPGVIAAIDAARTSITDPAQQSKALFLLAESKKMTAGSDPAKLKDAAVAYMRVAAHFDKSPEAPTALWNVADIQERTGAKDEAIQLYNTLANDARFKGTPLAASAAKKVADLKAAKG